MRNKKAISALLSAALCLNGIRAPSFRQEVSFTASASSISDLPADYQYAAEWIWTNRIERERSTVRRNTVFDQIVAGKGTINYVVKWQSYRTVTYEQRKQFETMLSNSINAWTDWLKGYENWPYEHIDVKVTGWAVIDKMCVMQAGNEKWTRSWNV